MRAYRARLSLTPEELEAVHSLVEHAHSGAVSGRIVKHIPFWEKLLDKVKRARKRTRLEDAERFLPLEDFE